MAAFGLSHQCRKEEAPENVARWIRPQQEAARCPCSGRSREDKGEGVDGAGQEARVAAADRRWGGTGSAYRAACQGGDEGKADRGAGGPQIGLDRLLAETDRGVASSRGSASRTPRPAARRVRSAPAGPAAAALAFWPRSVRRPHDRAPQPQRQCHHPCNRARQHSDDHQRVHPIDPRVDPPHVKHRLQRHGGGQVGELEGCWIGGRPVQSPSMASPCRQIPEY